MDTVLLADAETSLLQVLDRPARGEDIVIAKAGCPLVRLATLVKLTTPRRLGLLVGQVAVGPDFDVDDPLPDDIRLPFEGRLPEALTRHSHSYLGRASPDRVDHTMRRAWPTRTIKL